MKIIIASGKSRHFLFGFLTLNLFAVGACQTITFKSKI